MLRNSSLWLGEADPVVMPSYKEKAGTAPHYFVEDVLRDWNPTHLMGDSRSTYVDYFREFHNIRSAVCLSIVPEWT